MTTSERRSIKSVIRALRQVNIQGSLFGQTVAVRFGLSESDIEALESLIDMGATTAGRLSELTGLTTGAVTRVVDRLEQAGYVRRIPDPADRRRVIVEVVPERIAAIQLTLDRLDDASEPVVEGYSEEQLALINDFLTRMAEVTRTEAFTLRDEPPSEADGGATGQHAAPLGGLTSARLYVRSGVNDLVVQADPGIDELYVARFSGMVPHVRLREGTVFVYYKGRGLPWEWRRRNAELTLNARIPWAIELTGGANRVEAYLAGLSLSSFQMTGGADRIDLALGRPSGQVPIRFSGGASSLTIVRPRGTPLLLRLSGGAGAIEFDRQRLGSSSGQTVLASAGADEAADRFSVEMSGGASRIIVRESAGE
jgi:DNA-binding MarR family transcriptional regulator